MNMNNSKGQGNTRAATTTRDYRRVHAITLPILVAIYLALAYALYELCMTAGTEFARVPKETILVVKPQGGMTLMGLAIVFLAAPPSLIIYNFTMRRIPRIRVVMDAGSPDSYKNIQSKLARGALVVFLVTAPLALFGATRSVYVTRTKIVELPLFGFREVSHDWNEIRMVETEGTTERRRVLRLTYTVQFRDGSTVDLVGAFVHKFLASYQEIERELLPLRDVEYRSSFSPRAIENMRERDSIPGIDGVVRSLIDGPWESPCTEPK